MSRFDLTGKVALVTGASKGIGAATALALAEAGADLILGFRDINAAGNIAERIRGLGRDVLSVQMDITKMNEIRSAFESAKAWKGRLDILVNNVGVAPPNYVVDVTEEDFDHTLNVNLKGTYFCSQAAGRIMIDQGYGRIVNVSSQTGFIAIPEESVYCMTKAAINHMTRAMALEWANEGVTVNAIAPTFIETPGTDPWLSDPVFKQKVLDRIPMGRIGETSEVVGAIVFLASDAASLITGEILKIDGGWTAQ